jgi:hypothetical protein
MTTHRQSPTRHTDQADTPGACRPVSPGVLAIALLLSLAASVASAGVLDGSDPARLDRREAPRELTVRWLTDAVARAARDLASTECKPATVPAPIGSPFSVIAPDPALQASPCRDPRQTPISTIPSGWPAQGLLNLPPPAQR